MIAVGEAVLEPTLIRLFPDVNPWTLEEYLERYWSGVELGEPAWEKDSIFA